MSPEGNPAINVENVRSKMEIIVINHIVMYPAINVGHSTKMSGKTLT